MTLVHCRNEDLSSLIVKLQTTKLINGSSKPIESFTKTLIIKIKRNDSVVFGDYDHRSFDCEISHRELNLRL
ncbi:MAG: hypothetical protein VX642_11835 [Bdellovibrionota bacterium]|nr:hypothetical protein [Bdellovibrionota bacterium]